MSGSITQNPPTETNPLTDTEKSDVRKFMGYGVIGLSGVVFVYRFFQTEGLLEARMSYLTDTECALVRSYLATCNGLEASLAGVGMGATDTLVADAAASYKHNKNEIDDRVKLLNTFCRKLCGVFRLPPGPALGSGNTIDLYI